ncbi:type II CRISPR-associated endonuclease Cas1 [Francisella sp. LA112445]|uniref:type II CRISPR-associated endonuclease Cas1 n=1 Tax=Francisella sp. LA112445 TaxID=1395624 RepID=UPI001788D34E|nr:type II CRISPR-associated endonuclease Cas1 [Francisella sp. LA112445]QIW10330.1 type II CRISPR-associated endonuclease Cas1 [Francisella sp. LA112445]
MKHLIISEYGIYLGLEAGRLVVKNKEDRKYFPLNRLATVAIAKRGISFSSDLIEQFSLRGIKLFFLDFRGVAHSMLVGANQHAVVQARINQYRYIETNALDISIRLISAKIKNQRATLSYFNKHHKSANLLKAIEELKRSTQIIKNAKTLNDVLGYEGYAANIYFSALAQDKFLSESFANREGRGSQEIANSMLNFGYAILSSYILNAITNAGLEPYLGFLHQKRPGKMSLVLDLMEEYRAWVVDRVVIKLREQYKNKKHMDTKLKSALISQIQATIAKKYIYKGKKLRLEHIIQRQVYRLSGEFAGEHNYKPYVFKW